MTDSDIYPSTVQRSALLKLAEALASASTALRRGECGGWRINGRLGHFYAVPGTIDRPGVEGSPIYCLRHSVRRGPPLRRSSSSAS